MRPHLFLALSLAIALDASPQSFFSETMEIRVTNVDVIVTTKDGKPVTGLTRADFELYENGVRKELSNFLEIRGDLGAQIRGEASIPETEIAAAQTDVRRRHILVFIDNADLSVSARNQLLPHLRQFLESNVREGDDVTIATWASALNVEMLPRLDQPSLDETMKRLSLQTATFDRYKMRQEYEQKIEDLITTYMVLDRKPPFSEGVAITRLQGMQLVHNMRAKTEALKSLIAAFRGVDGRKVLVLITQQFSTNPAEELFMHLDSMRERFADGENANVFGDTREFEIPGLVTELAEVANSSGVSLYPIDASGKLSDLELPDASVERRLSTNRVALVPATSGASMRGIAEETGGKALTGSSNWQLAFNTIANDLTSYYSLGYRSEGGRADRLKKIEVRPKNRKYVVRTRNAVIDKTVESEMLDAVAANLFRDAGVNDLKISVAAGTPAPSGEAMIVPVTITIPTSALTLIPEGTDLAGRFSIFAAFVRTDGAVSKTARQEQQFRFPAASLERRKEITVKLDVNADARTDGISIGVMDDVSHATGFASVKLTR